MGDWIQRPSKFEPEPKEPLVFQRETKYFRNDKNNRAFGANAHTSWENFQATVRTRSYQNVIKGTKYKSLIPPDGEWTFKKLEGKAETPTPMATIA